MDRVGAGSFAVPGTADELDLLVLEYLMHTGCDNPAHALKHHMRERAHAPAVWRPVGEEVRQRLYVQALSAFDRGEGEELFTLWESYVPPLVRKRDRTCAKLEFYLHIYFAVYPLHANNDRRDAAALGASMERFKRYLETNGATLSATAEFLAYYALPYVPQLTEHPAFRELLTPGWAGALRQRVAEFLRTTPQLASEPKLLTIYRSYESLTLEGEHGVPRNPVVEASADLHALKERLVESELRLVEAKQLAAQREAALSRTAIDLLRVASEQQGRLTQLAGAGTPLAAEQRAAITRSADTLAALGLQLTAAPVPVPSPSRSHGGGNGNGGSGGGDGAYGNRGAYAHDGFEGGGGIGEYGGSAAEVPPPLPPQQQQQEAMAAISEGELEQRQRLPPRPRSVPLFAALNYGPVLRDLQTLPGDERALLLQALRWRLMKSTGRQRQLVLATFVQHDLLSDKVVQACCTPDEPAVLEQTVRLLNHFASFAAGRAYILSKEGLLQRLCAILLAEKADTPTRQNALGALQKLSLRRAPQSAMIEGGVVGWLASVLGDSEALSEYTIEYATALLMNLSLRLAGKRACEAPELDILGVLNRLLEYDNGQVRTYVNGTLYSVLTRPSLRERALEMGLPDILEALLAHSDEMSKRQLQYILPLLSSDLPPTAEADAEQADEAQEEDDNDDDDDDDDDDEPDDDDESELPRPGGMPIGEELLASWYIASAYDAQAEVDGLEASSALRPSPKKPTPNKSGATARGKNAAPDELPQRPITPNTHGGPKQPAQVPPPIEYPNLDGSEDIEVTFASRNKLARTPAPGAQGGGLANVDFGPISPRPQPPRPLGERRAVGVSRSPPSGKKSTKPPSAAGTAASKPAGARKGSVAAPTATKSSAKPTRGAAAGASPKVDGAVAADVGANADATAARRQDAPETLPATHSHEGEDDAERSNLAGGTAAGGELAGS